MGNFSKTILIASVALCLHISAFSQGISLKNREITVKEAMELLKEKSGYSFVFSSADVNTNKRISISTDKATIDDVVKQILQGQNNLTYEIQNKRIIVKKIQPGDKTKNKKIKAIGKVVDDAGEPIIGATVREQGTTNGTITGIDGSFSLDVADNVNLEISYIGYETRKIRAQQGKKLDITMREDANVLDEIVVLGYGNIRRSDVTGSIASVSSESISKVASASVADALAGKMAGVQITTADGALDAEISVRVRGGGSITQDNSPLFLVDGFPVDDLSGIPPTDIESIDVLKEASMTAIYGARGANGVVIVTTKNPKMGKTTVQFNSYLQMRTLARKIPVMNNYEFVMAEYEYQMIRKGSDEGFIKNFGYYDDIDLYKYTNTTDWQDEILGGNPISQYYNITVNGGNEKTKFNLSYTRNKDEGQLIGSGLTRNNINLKLNHQLFKNPLLYVQRGVKLTNTANGASTDVKTQSIDIPIELKWEMGISDNFDLFLGVGPSFSFLVDEDNWGRKLAHIAVDVIDKDLSSMGWRSTEVGINLGGGVKIVNHLMLSCYYNIGLTQSAKHHIGGNKHDAIDQIFDGDVFESKNRYWQLSLSYVF